MLRGYFPGCQHKEWIMTRVCGSFIRPKDFTTTDDMQEDMTWLLGYVFKYVTTAMVIDYHGSGSFQENKAEETCLWICIMRRLIMSIWPGNVLEIKRYVYSVLQSLVSNLDCW